MTHSKTNTTLMLVGILLLPNVLLARLLWKADRQVLSLISLLWPLLLGGYLFS